MWKMRGYFMSDVELGKKDDDHHKHGRTGSGVGLTPVVAPTTWLPSRGPRRRSLKAVLFVTLIGVVVYFFFKNLPNDLGPNPLMRRPNFDHSAPYPPSPRYQTGLQQGQGDSQPYSPSDPNSRAKSPSGSGASSSSFSSSSAERTYNGPVKFLELASSLHAISPTRGSSAINKNVLFAAASLRSAATLLPIACQMGGELKNYVHFALMSRSGIDLAELQKLNGIDGSCHLIFHDARTEQAQISTDARMETAVFRALHHIHMYMHPQAVIVDASSDEEAFLGRGAQQHVKATGSTLIELPRNSGKTLEWMTKLDSAALRTWNDLQIDILINATPMASGSLIRLLRSLIAADYTASPVPHLTIELPPDVDPPTKTFLESFSWPPAHLASARRSKSLTVRHRIPRQALTEEESSARFLESFWPSKPKSSHVLVLSPRVELEPQFFHYLKYTALQYRDASRLFAISLEQPTRLLDEKAPLTLPSRTTDIESPEAGGDAPTSFLWQAPSSNAVLYMGEKWMDLHKFVSRSLVTAGRGSTGSLLAEKLVSKKHPSWLEHALRLARLRGYYTLYPGEETARNLATVHSELYHAPEEYEAEAAAQAAGPGPLLADDATEEEVEEARQRARAELETESPPSSAAGGGSPASLLDALPSGAELRPVVKLPLLAWDGAAAEAWHLDREAARLAAVFRREVGGCRDGGAAAAAAEGDAEAEADAPAPADSKDVLIQDLFCDSGAV